MAHWIRFFLNAVIAIAGKGNETFHKIFSLKNEIDGKIVTLKRKAENGKHLMTFLYRQPVINAMQASKHLDITPKYTYALIDDFISLGILRETIGQQRNRVFIFGAYLKCFM